MYGDKIKIRYCKCGHSEYNHYGPEEDCTECNYPLGEREEVWKEFFKKYGDDNRGCKCEEFEPYNIKKMSVTTKAKRELR